MANVSKCNWTRLRSKRPAPSRPLRCCVLPLHPPLVRVPLPFAVPLFTGYSFPVHKQAHPPAVFKAPKRKKTPSLPLSYRQILTQDLRSLLHLWILFQHPPLPELLGAGHLWPSFQIHWLLFSLAQPDLRAQLDTVAQFLPLEHLLCHLHLFTGLPWLLLLSQSLHQVSAGF